MGPFHLAVIIACTTDASEVENFIVVLSHA